MTMTMLLRKVKKIDHSDVHNVKQKIHGACSGYGSPKKEMQADFEKQRPQGPLCMGLQHFTCARFGRKHI